MLHAQKLLACNIVWKSGAGKSRRNFFPPVPLLRLFDQIQISKYFFQHSIFGIFQINYFAVFIFVTQFIFHYILVRMKIERNFSEQNGLMKKDRHRFRRRESEVCEKNIRSFLRLLIDPYIQKSCFCQNDHLAEKLKNHFV